MRFLRAALAAALVAAPAIPASAQQKLKVYIAVDMEGIAGIVTPAQVGGADYEWGRPLMLAETNAAIAAAFDAGATEVVVNDAHGSHTNLRADLIDRRSTLITGRPKPMGMIEGLDASFDAVIFIGFHGHAAQVPPWVFPGWSGSTEPRCDTGHRTPSRPTRCHDSS